MRTLFLQPAAMAAMPPAAINPGSKSGAVAAIALPPEDDDEMLLNLPDTPAPQEAAQDSEYFAPLKEDLAQPDPNEPNLEDALGRDED